MEVRIGILNAPREITLDMADDTSADELKASVEAGVADSTMVWLTDRKGRQTGFPGAQIAYVEVGTAGDDNRIGFS